MTTQYSDELAYLTGKNASTPHPLAITAPNGGGKFDYDGNALPWPGNTIICRIDQSSAVHKKLSQIQSKLKNQLPSKAFTFLPPSSFHMTVFEGMSGAGQATQVWPKDLDKGIDLTTATNVLSNRLDNVVLPDTHDVKVTSLYGGYTIRLMGADEAQESSLRQCRVILRNLTGIHPASFDSYGFHITLAYLTRWLSIDEANLVIDISRRLGDQLKSDLPVITLGASEFCSFESMYHFAPIKRL